MPKHDINIQAQIQYLHNHSNPSERRFVYAYTITISNRGEAAAQLISRYWKIRDANNRIREVEGAGVVGEQPRIVPGAAYTYTSSAILETETGTMEGHYVMQSDDGESFKAIIPTFALVPAHAIH